MFHFLPIFEDTLPDNPWPMLEGAHSSDDEDDCSTSHVMTYVGDFLGLKLLPILGWDARTLENATGGLMVPNGTWDPKRGGTFSLVVPSETLAFREDRVQMVAWLIQSGCPISPHLLQCAAQSGNVKMVNLIVESGILGGDVDKAIIVAALFGHTQVVSLLVRGCGNQPPVDAAWAAFVGGHAETLQYLQSIDASIADAVRVCATVSPSIYHWLWSFGMGNNVVHCPPLWMQQVFAVRIADLFMPFVRTADPFFPWIEGNTDTLVLFHIEPGSFSRAASSPWEMLWLDSQDDECPPDTAPSSWVLDILSSAEDTGYESDDFALFHSLYHREHDGYNSIPPANPYSFPIDQQPKGPRHPNRRSSSTLEGTSPQKRPRPTTSS